MLSVERRGAALVATLARPPVNAIDDALLARLDALVGEAESDASVSLVHLRGSERAFCAGVDLAVMRACLAGAGSETMVDLVRRMQRVFARLEHAPFVTLAEIEGAALGGGLELALACDLRVCRTGVALGLTESRLGGLAGNGSVRLAHLIGPSRAKELLYTGDTIDTGRALAWGLVNRVVDEGTALAAARGLAETIASRGPLSNRLAKRLVDSALDLPLDAALSMSTSAQQQIFDSVDLHEGVDAFFGKREPRFGGR